MEQASTDPVFYGLIVKELSRINGDEPRQGQVLVIEAPEGHKHTVEVYDPNGMMLDSTAFIGDYSYNQAMACASQIEKKGYELRETSNIAKLVLKLMSQN